MQKPPKPAAPKKPTSKTEYMQMKISIRHLKVTVKILVNLITHIQTIEGKLVIFLLDGTTLNCSFTLTALLAKLPWPQFEQCHVSSIVNINHYTKHVKGDSDVLEIVGKYKVSVSRQFREAIRKAIG